MAKYVGGAAVGLAAGFTLGCVGWGGAQIIKPSLSKFLGLSTIAANGTSLTSLSAAATTGAFRFGFSDQSDFATAACIAVPSIFGARFGVKVSPQGCLLLLVWGPDANIVKGVQHNIHQAALRIGVCSVCLLFCNVVDCSEAFQRCPGANF